MHPVISSLPASHAALDVGSHYPGSVIGHLPLPSAHDAQLRDGCRQGASLAAAGRGAILALV